MERKYFDFEDFDPIWHLCTPGESMSVIFRDRDDYVFGMNLIALSAAELVGELNILTFQIMSNHLHFVLVCKDNVLNKFFFLLKKRLQRYMSNTGNVVNLNDFVPNVFRINDIRYLQTVIAYVNRNGYLVDNSSTPFTYEWGANRYFFNNFTRNELSVKISDISVDNKRRMFKSRNFCIPDNYQVTNGYVIPFSYCNISLAESFFKDANQYFHLCSRQVETYSIIAKELGDRVIYTDEEIFSAVLSICLKRYNVKNPVLLNKDAKIDLAKIMHYDYNASNKQIKRIIRIDEGILESLFPVRR